MKLKSGIITIILVLVTILSCGCNKPTVDSIDDNYRVGYEIFVGSFSDSNKDGIGDIQGIINRMDYLNDGDITSGESLGVQLLWLSPIFSSPSYHKYDVANYYKIDEKFGTEQDLVELIELCHERNVKIIIDLPINHTSSANVWFSKFTSAQVSGDKTNQYYDYYTNYTRDNLPNGRQFNLIPSTANTYYECNFSTDMPELNFDNTAVRQAVVDIAKYYLDLGIDGFRFDAVKYLYYGHTAQSVDFWKWYMQELKNIKPDIYCVGECWSGDSETLEYIEAVNCFNFQMAQAEGFVANAVKGANMGIFTNYIQNYLTKMQQSNDSAMLMPFLSNHDMDRIAGSMTLATYRMQMAANLYILCSGSPIIYYGEEIGMRGSRGGDSTDANRRLAMLWGDDDTVRNPQGATYQPEKQTNGTVEEHLKNKDSLYNYYCKLIALRNKYPQIARGNYTALTYDESRFGGFSIEYNGETIGLFHNTSIREITIDLAQNAKGANFSQICDFLGQGKVKLDGTILTIGPQTSVVVK